MDQVLQAGPCSGLCLRGAAPSILCGASMPMNLSFPGLTKGSSLEDLELAHTHKERDNDSSVQCAPRYYNSRISIVSRCTRVACDAEQVTSHRTMPPCKALPHIWVI